MTAEPEHNRKVVEVNIGNVINGGMFTSMPPSMDELSEVDQGGEHRERQGRRAAASWPARSTWSNRLELIPILNGGGRLDSHKTDGARPERPPGRVFPHETVDIAPLAGQAGHAAHGEKEEQC